MSRRAAISKIDRSPAVRPKPVARSKPVARIVCDAERRRAVQAIEQRSADQFAIGQPIHAVALIRNDGMYPHRDVGEPLVYPGDPGIVRESWRFLGKVYYTVEFATRSVFVIMRGREMRATGSAPRLD